MRSRLAILALAAAGLGPAGAAQPDAPLAVGDWVQVKGEFHGTVFHAQEIERIDDPSWSVKGPLVRFDPASGALDFGGATFPLDGRTRIQDDAGNDADVSLLQPGARVKLSLREREEGGFRVRRVRLLDPASSPRLRLEGRVGLTTRLENETYFELLGIEVRADGKTVWNGIARPRYTTDDEDFRPGRGVRLGRAGTLSGEARLDYKGEFNFDLADVVDGDEQTGRLRTRIEWIFPTTAHFSGMVQIKTESERALVDEANDVEEDDDLTLGRAYVMFHNVIGRRGSIQAGRSRFDDRRDWLFNRDIDALRFYYDAAHFRLEAAVAEELVDPAPRHEDVRNLYAALHFYPGKNHTLSAYVLDRDDRLVINGNPRDFSPHHRGLRAEGEGKHWEYWLEAAQVRGRDRGVPLEGHAVDAGVTLIAPSRIEPSFTFGYAVGSGDDDPLDGVSGTFRQSGLHLNNGKFNGVSSFRYYGELMRPELANLRVATVGVGIRPRSKTSLDVIYHRYELDQPASQLVDAAMDDRTLNLVDLDIGEEWDLVFGYEQLRHWEFELDLGYFIPGDAFLGPTDDAATARLKIKYIF